MMMMMMMMMMVVVVMVVVGKEEQKGKKKERQSLYTLTPDHPPLRAEYVKISRFLLLLPICSPNRGCRTRRGS